MIERPTITDAPGLVWRRRVKGWEARWVCRTDLRERGFPFKVYRILLFTEPPKDFEIEYVREQCHQRQGEMLAFSQQGLPVVSSFDGTIRGLIECYRGRKDSPYNKKIRYRTRRFYDNLFESVLALKWHDENGLERKASMVRVAEIRRALIEQWHEIYLDRGNVAMGHQVMGILRNLFGFGAGVLENDDCARLCIVMGKMRFEQPKPRNEILTAEMVIAVRKQAHEMGVASIALAQAFQFDGMLRQKDVIGEWVPLNEKRVPLTEIVCGNDKWIRGLRWEEIDENMRLTHITSKRQKEITLNLMLMPMVMEELGHPISRSQLPATGPIIVDERGVHPGQPWFMTEFRRKWRECADKAGIPKKIRNQDTRAGAITEATMSGAPLESIKHAATHSDISMTQRYARAAEEKTEQVMRARIAFRNKTGN